MKGSELGKSYMFWGLLSKSLTKKQMKIQVNIHKKIIFERSFMPRHRARFNAIDAKMYWFAHNQNLHSPATLLGATV